MDGVRIDPCKFLFVPQNVPFCSSKTFNHSCGGTSFGTRATEAWVRLMQYAEGPKDFEMGYRKMIEYYGTDLSRRQYITSLYNDDQKTHFKRRLQFSNGILVDICEVFFATLKTWVYGQSRSSSSLTMSIVRIAEGCRRLIREPFLKDVKKN